jgi:uncharacterized protein (TIRG00374 family)
VSRRTLLVLVAVVVTVVFAAIAVRGADPDAVWEAITSCDPLWLLPSVLALGMSVFVRALRWRALFDPSRRPGLWPVTAATLVGYLFLQILPLRAGEAARIVALSQRSGMSKAEIAGTALLERVYDLVAVLGLLFVLLPWLPEITWLRAAASLGAAVFVLIVIAVVVLAVWGDRAVHTVMRPFARLPVVPADRLEEIGHNLAQGLVGLRRPGLALWALFLSVASWVLLGISFWCVFESFDLGVGVVAGIFATIAAGLTAVLPAGPSGIGVFEASIVVALGAYGVDESEALSAALVAHAVGFVSLVAAGLPVIRFHVRRTMQAAET